MAQITIPVSIGELVDKITILRIKQQKIEAGAKRENVDRELRALTAVCAREGIPLETPLVSELEEINLALWVIEDDIREKERQSAFDEEFIELARSVYKTNDRRFAVKARINEEAGSAYREEKSYKPY